MVVTLIEALVVMTTKVHCSEEEDKQWKSIAGKYPSCHNIYLHETVIAILPNNLIFQITFFASPNP
jgi:hypothetical protein